MLDNLGFAHDLDDLISKFEDDPDFANSDELKEWFDEQMEIKHAQHKASGAKRWNDSSMSRGWDMEDARAEFDEYFA